MQGYDLFCILIRFIERKFINIPLIASLNSSFSASLIGVGGKPETF
jgi:hypothetical protein